MIQSRALPARFSLGWLPLGGLSLALALGGALLPPQAMAQDQPATGSAAATPGQNAGPGPASTAPAPAATASNVPLIAHRAVYDLTLESSSGNSAPTDARGLIAYDFTGTACDGYAMNFRQRTELQPAEGPVHVSDMRSATFEDGAGKSYRFRTQMVVDKGESQLIEGNAVKAGNGSASVTLTEPDKSVAPLPAGITFPTEQMELVLAAARVGQPTVSAKLYDGSDDGRKIFNTLSVIGKPVTTPDEKAAQVDQLKNVRRWPVVVSYFDEAKNVGTPDYILSFDLYENGISSDLKLDYGSFVLKGELKELDFLPPSKTPCDK